MRRRDFLAAGSAFAVLGAVGCVPRGDRPESEGSAEPSVEDAFFYAFPLYELARTEQDRTQAVDGSPGTLNTLVHRAQLLDYTARMVTAPNNDTIYSSAFLELSGGPIEVTAPSSTDRYYCVAFMNAFTDNFAYIGTRATQGRGGRYWIVGPQWSGTVPPGVTLVESSTNDVWMLMRTLVDGPADLAAARAFQTGLTITVPDDRPAARPFTVKATDVTDPENFLGLVNEVLARSPGGRGQTARAPRFAAFGIATDAAPSAELLSRWRGYIPSALEGLREDFRFRDLVVDGWSYQPPGVGDFGENDKLRATVALGGLAALGEEEAMYFHANFDADGQPLSGEHAYRWHVPAGGVPADAFWSLTMYEATPDGRYFLVQNPIDRYAIGDRTRGLVVDADGSFEILVQREPPDGPLAANWLPAPEGPMRLALRAYLPREELRSRSWSVPPLVRVV